jgi:hypothetical protein
MQNVISFFVVKTTGWKISRMCVRLTSCSLRPSPEPLNPLCRVAPWRRILGKLFTQIKTSAHQKAPVSENRGTTSCRPWHSWHDMQIAYPEVFGVSD